MPTTKQRRHINKHLRVQVLARDSYRCRMCGRSKDEVALEVDHVLALADGGTDEVENLATLCRDCNSGKSAYRFADYRSMSVIPEDLADSFKFFHDDPTGDLHRYHLYLYYKASNRSGGTVEKYHHTWTIPGTAYDTSRDKAALELRRRTEEQESFVAHIKRELISERRLLIRTEEGICKVDA